MKNFKSTNGITLIALVITIIVLIILAMVSIAMLTGPNGLLNKSVEAKIENAHGEVRERLQLETNAYLAEKLEGTYSGDLLTYLQEKGFVKEDGTTVDVAKLTDGTQTVTGNEKESGKDVYKIEEKEVSTGDTTKLASTEVVKIAASEDSSVKEYSINYYDESGNKKEIGLLIDNLSLGSTDTNKPNTELISFTVDGISYKCKKDLTWENFIDSEYNSLPFIKGNQLKGTYIGSGYSPYDYGLYVEQKKYHASDLVCASQPLNEIYELYGGDNDLIHWDATLLFEKGSNVPVSLIENVVDYMTYEARIIPMEHVEPF